MFHGGRKKRKVFWCPGGKTPVAIATRRPVRCPVCTRKFLAAEAPCCGSDDPDPYRNRDNRRRGGMRHGKSCIGWRVPPHKAYY